MNQEKEFEEFENIINDLVVTEEGCKLQEEAEEIRDFIKGKIIPFIHKNFTANSKLEGMRENAIDIHTHPDKHTVPVIKAIPVQAIDDALKE